MSKITKLLKDELRNNVNALDYFEAKHEIYDSWGDLNFAVFGGKPETVEEENLYERVAKEFLDELKEKREWEVSQKGIFVKKNNKIEIMTKSDFYLEICGIDGVNSTPYERALAKEKAKSEGRFFVYYPKWRTYMLEHFNAQELSDALAILLDSQEFEDFANDLINESESAFYSQCVDFALKKMSDKILEGSSLDFQEAVTSWVTERLNKSGSFVSLEIPYYLTESGCNETIEFNPKTLLN